MSLAAPVSQAPSRPVLASQHLEDRSPEEILRWSIAEYGDGLTMATAFGAEGCVLLDMLARLDEHRVVRVFNLDTGYQFDETLDMCRRVRERYGIEVTLVRPRESVEAMERRFGGPLYAANPDLCCKLRKIEPLREALEGSKAWISAIRREQTPDRAHVPVVAWDQKFDLAKISPLARWSSRDVWAYIRINEVPYNPLHDQGYPSIGCRPCTRAVMAGENDRAGRWSTLAKLECGLHSR